MSIKTVDELMIPLSEYAVVSHHSYVRDALKAIKSAQANLKFPGQAARAALVVDDDAKVIGQIEQINFLEALEPKYGMLGDLQPLSRAGLSDEMIQAMIDNLEFWQNDLAEACIRLSKTSVREIMDPLDKSITRDTPLYEAVHKFVIWQVKRILVSEEDEIIGVLRLTDVFNNLTEYIESIE